MVALNHSGDQAGFRGQDCRHSICISLDHRNTQVIPGIVRDWVVNVVLLRRRRLVHDPVELLSLKHKTCVRENAQKSEKSLFAVYRFIGFGFLPLKAFLMRDSR